jgi:DNA-binding NtrC family response regulator
MSETATRELPRLKERLEVICIEMIDRGIVFSEAVGQFERCFILEIVRRNKGNLLRAAEKLGIHRNTLAARMARYKSRRR